MGCLFNPLCLCCLQEKHFHMISPWKSTSTCTNQRSTSSAMFVAKLSDRRPVYKSIPKFTKKPRIIYASRVEKVQKKWIYFLKDYLFPRISLTSNFGCWALVFEKKLLIYKVYTYYMWQYVGCFRSLWPNVHVKSINKK